MQSTHPSMRPFSPREQENEKEKSDAYVLDSYALFALLQNEEGQDIVTDLVMRAEKEQALLYLSLINWGEIRYIVERKQGQALAQEVMSDIDALPIALCEVDRQRVSAAAHIKANCPISYADAFAIALAEELGVTVVTGDPEFKSVESVVPVLWLREV